MLVEGNYKRKSTVSDSTAKPNCVETWNYIPIIMKSRDIQNTAGGIHFNLYNSFKKLKAEST